MYSFTRDSVALKAPRFPILTLDERQLTPALGFIFDVRWLLPGESIVSILWKFARANGLAGHTLVQLMGADVDPYEGVEPMRDVIDVKRLRRMLCLPVKVLRASLLDAGQRGRHHPTFRYCRQCTARGHHSVTYQMFSENRCPAHDRMLETQCRHCGRETPYILNAILVGSPYRCAWCGTLYGTRFPPVLSTGPTMRKEDRIAIARHFHNRMAGSFCLGGDDRRV
ncbi:hypothetical protein [Paraburkholderia sp. BL17N1]|uniref:hypothetical protein n=1 Tax=Paraburkholderia sp. BL17N1 TaxID=1938798 RepID=UPI001F5476AB|nr:hypothetical protein [Paraburkholderia sp. BL17N1]